MNADTQTTISHIFIIKLLSVHLYSALSLQIPNALFVVTRTV